MTGAVFVKSFDAPEWNEREILRYASCREAERNVTALLGECMAESARALSYRVCYARFPVQLTGDVTDLGFARTQSKNLQKNLSGCREIVVFAATVGLGIDRLAMRYAKTSPAKAFMFDAIGSERVEALCDVFCDEIKAEAQKEGFSVRPRFSPGYGDLPLDLQKDIFRALSPEKHIGAALCRSMMISPSKTVTAIVGIG